jgi:hypothetical protein
MVATWVDFKDIKSRVCIMDVLVRYGLLELLELARKYELRLAMLRADGYAIQGHRRKA